MKTEENEQGEGLGIKAEAMFGSYERQIMEKSTALAKAEAIIEALNEKLSEATQELAELRETVDALVEAQKPKDQDKPEKHIEHQGRTTVATEVKKPELAAVGGS